MSAYAQPISATRFAAALQELPLESLYAKVAEIQNSIAHLEHSNSQLQEFADEGDTDCQDAIEENMVVIERQRERIELVRREVFERGFEWDETQLVNGTNNADTIQEVVPEESALAQNGQPSASSEQTTQGGRLGDDELARRLEERMEGEGDDGVHL